MPDTMPAVYFLGDGRSELRDAPVPQPRAGEARVKLARAAICGTDVHKYRRPAARQPRKPDGQAVISGHEPVGWVEFAPRDRGSLALTREYDTAIAGVAARHGVPLCSVSAAMEQRDELVHPDGVHANDLGHRLIGNRVFETVVTRTRLLR